MPELNLCIEHKQEWKHSHYASMNCDHCRVILSNEKLKKALKMVCKQIQAQSNDLYLRSSATRYMIQFDLVEFKHEKDLKEVLDG